MVKAYKFYIIISGWEGGDEWLRSQFKLYLLSLMRTSEIEGNFLFYCN